MQLQDIAVHVHCVWEGDPTLEISGVAALEEAQSGQLTFLTEARFRPLLGQTQASAVILSEHEPCPPHLACIRSRDPRLTFAQVIELFYQPWQQPTGIHPTAVVGSQVTLAEEIALGAYAVIGDQVKIGRGTQIHAHVTIYPQVTIGEDCVLLAGCVIHERTVIGDRCVIHSGAVIGDAGFGYIPQADGSWYPMQQSGSVVLGNDVHVGSNTTVDRAAVGHTQLADGVKLDNLVMIGHGVKIGAHSLLVSQVGIAGGTELGRQVIMGGQSGVTGHVKIGDRVIAASRTGVTSSVEPNQVIAGFPHQPDKAWRKMAVAEQKIPELLKTIRQLEQRIAQIEQILPSSSLTPGSSDEVVSEAGA